MGIGSLLNRLMDWTEEGGDNAMYAKSFALAAIPAAVLSGVVFHVSAQNLEALEETFENLDSRPTVVFQSVADCVDKKYVQFECESSQANAIVLSQETGTMVSAERQFESNATSNMIAWQAAADDLSVSAPLYDSAEDGKAVRQDSKLFSLEL